MRLSCITAHIGFFFTFHTLPFYYIIIPLVTYTTHHKIPLHIVTPRIIQLFAFLCTLS